MKHDTRSKKRKGSASSIISPDPESKSKSKRTKNLDEENPNNRAVVIRDDVEFDVHDHDGRIQRYQERIAGGFCKVTYKDKIGRLEAAKKSESVS